jgi:hypothetical protein
MKAVKTGDVRYKVYRKNGDVFCRSFQVDRIVGEKCLQLKPDLWITLSDLMKWKVNKPFVVRKNMTSWDYKLVAEKQARKLQTEGYVAREESARIVLTRPVQ